MFTGIVKEIVTLRTRQIIGGKLVITLTRPRLTRYQPGDSILLNGICSTIVAQLPKTLSVQFMPQTRRLTTVDNWKIGDKINVEAPVTLQTKLSGALVLGHIDQTMRCRKFNLSAGGGTNLTLVSTHPLPAYVVPQGGVTVDGVNLTITACTKYSLSCALTDYTFNHTNLTTATAGKLVNVEFDYLAKIISSLMRNRRRR